MDAEEAYTSKDFADDFGVPLINEDELKARLRRALPGQVITTISTASKPPGGKWPDDFIRKKDHVHGVEYVPPTASQRIES